MTNIGWVPFGLRWEENEPVVDWCDLGDRRLAEPFFDQDVQKALTSHNHTNRYRQTPLGALEDFQATGPVLAPSGFIFHMSRCGSTLVSRMLASLSTNIVIVEPEILESVLAAARAQKLSFDCAARLLKNVVAAFGQRRIGCEQNLIIKFNSRQIRDFPIIDRVFPQTRGLFLYRDPNRVMSSLLRGSTGSLPPGLIESGLGGETLSDDETAFLRNHPEEFWARVVMLCCQAALDYSQSGNTFFVNYDQLPDAVWNSIGPFFDLILTSSDINAMKQIAVYHSKKPSVVFTGDQNAEQSPIIEVSVRQIMPLYEKLEFKKMETVSAKE